MSLDVRPMCRCVASSAYNFFRIRTKNEKNLLFGTTEEKTHLDYKAVKMRKNLGQNYLEERKQPEIEVSENESQNQRERERGES